MVIGNSWQQAGSGRNGKSKANSGRFDDDRRGAVQKKIWDNGRRQATKGFIDSIRESSISFYFTNFPDIVKQSELRRVFSLAGDVVDLFIPAKLDKLVRRFGFVRFQNERDVQRLERRLSNGWLGTYKIQVNRSHVSGFVPAVKGKDGAGSVLAEKGKAVVVAPIEGVVDEVVGIPVKTNTEVTQNVGWGDWPKLGVWNKRPFGGKKSNFNMDFEVDEERVKSLSSCYVGILSESRSATALEFQHSLVIEGYHTIKVTPMGGGIRSCCPARLWVQFRMP